MLLIYKRHSVLVVAGFRAYIAEAHMAYWARHCASKGLLVRCMSS